MKIEKIKGELLDILFILSRGTTIANGMFKTSEKGEVDRIYLLGYIDGRLRQLINSIEIGSLKENLKSEVKDETKRNTKRNK